MFEIKEKYKTVPHNNSNWSANVNNLRISLWALIADKPVLQDAEDKNVCQAGCAPPRSPWQTPEWISEREKPSYGRLEIAEVEVSVKAFHQNVEPSLKIWIKSSQFRGRDIKPKKFEDAKICQDSVSLYEFCVHNLMITITIKCLRWLEQTRLKRPWVNTTKLLQVRIKV